MYIFEDLSATFLYEQSKLHNHLATKNNHASNSSRNIAPKIYVRFELKKNALLLNPCSIFVCIFLKKRQYLFINLFQSKLLFFCPIYPCYTLQFFLSNTPLPLCFSLKLGKIWHETEEHFFVYGCLVISNYIKRCKKGQKLQF